LPVGQTNSDDDSTANRSGGDRGTDSLDALVFDELRGLAAAFMRTQSPGHTLQPTALVSEAYLRIMRSSPQALSSRAHFLAVAAKAMRHVLINHALARKTLKRGGASSRVDIDVSVIGGDDSRKQIEVLMIHEALQLLEEVDPRRARVVEAKVFGGLTNDEIAEVLGVSTTTVESDWRTARAWLAKEMQD